MKINRSLKHLAFGGQKSFGEEYDGIHRMTFIIDENGVVERVIDKVKTKDQLRGPNIRIKYTNYSTVSACRIKHLNWSLLHFFNSSLKYFVCLR